MKADYSRIAPNYDRTRARQPLEADSVVAAMVEACRANSYRALDLGCGTGNYLLAQLQSGPTSICWDGLDLSRDMLEITKKKVADRASLTIGRAEELPYSDETFNFVMVRAMFHHVQNKDQGLNEITRVLKPGGYLHIVNGAYEYRPGHWVYRYFPATWAIDEARFWRVELLFTELQRRGMRPEATVTLRKYYETKAEVQLWAANRDLSQLAMLSDDLYTEGMARLADEPNGTIPTEMAILDLTAVRP
jgi:ubiquinone/menaquinone biosynthesis C-methylase UbiE